ncbi:hypothetical protein DXG03_003338 [Asterophora parasitica]|uniref:Glutamine amidotransferase domain-containing protein n=1 Tax=Asterophora parasitica TaxID=117018 RepID=A0A9P7G3B9_9AGAR|nr:hypothetical protein DXG03_003338 [Asterophora parasitica]
MSLRLALLVTGSPPEPVRAEYGDYSVIYTKWLRASLPQGSTATFTLDPYDVVHKMEYPSDAQLDGYYDGILYTGSAASAYEDRDWINKLVAFSARVVNEKPHIKVIGICFGHQILARALGGSVVPNDGKWEVGITSLELTDMGKRLFGVETINIQQMHRDHVPSIPSPFHLLGSTSVSLNQGMVRFAPGTAPDQQSLKTAQVLTLQGHPEFIEGIVTGMVAVRAKTGVMSQELAADVQRRKDWRNDGTGVLGKAAWAVLGVKA